MSGLLQLAGYSEWVVRGLAVLLDVSLKGTVVLVMAVAASVLLHRASAASRHLLWLLAIVGLLALPVLSVALPGWQLRILPATVSRMEAPPWNWASKQTSSKTAAVV